MPKTTPHITVRMHVTAPHRIIISLTPIDIAPDDRFLYLESEPAVYPLDELRRPFGVVVAYGSDGWRYCGIDDDCCDVYGCPRPTTPRGDPACPDPSRGEPPPFRGEPALGERWCSPAFAFA